MKKQQLKQYDMGTGVVAFSTTRHGGYSTGRYAEFNINRYCGDSDEAIRQNRALLCSQLGIQDDCLLMPHQTHETQVVRIDADFLALSATERMAALEATDALMTDVAGVCIGVSTADCIPVLLYDREHRAACAIHAGWRGTMQRIVQRAVAAMTDAYGSRASQLVAQIGPGISLDSFEVGDEVYNAFHQAGFDMAVISRRYPVVGQQGGAEKWHIDLPRCNRLQLQETGIPQTNIAVAAECTYKLADSFFSARRLGQQSGRVFTGIMLR